MISFSLVLLFFFFKQKTAYEMRISDWSSDVCSSDLANWDRSDRSQKAPTFIIEREPRHACDEARANRPEKLNGLKTMAHEHSHNVSEEIGRASCRERVCQYV